jgi:hypothetical protein
MTNPRPFIETDAGFFMIYKTRLGSQPSRHTYQTSYVAHPLKISFIEAIQP